MRWKGSMSTGERSTSRLRLIVDPFVVAPPSGVRTRTRIRPTATEEEALERIGVFLGGLYRQTLVSRLKLGRVTAKDQGIWRTEEKRHLTAQSSSRWAGALTRVALDSYQLGVRNLTAEARSLQAAIEKIGARLDAPVGGTTTPSVTTDGHSKRKPKTLRGYATENERFAKSRRKGHLEERLAGVAKRIEAGRPRIVAGSRRLWRTRQCLHQADMTVAEWEQRWADERMFLTADGESGKKFGNETIRVTDDGVLTLKVPAALVAELGVGRLTVSGLVSLTTHRGGEWADRVGHHRAIRYDLHRDERGRWYLDASWGYPEALTVPLDALRTQRTLGVDLNDGHVDVAVIDRHGNVVGTPQRLDYRIDGTTGHRDAQVRHVVTRLIHAARQAGCASISIENLGFEDARATGRETMGRGKRGKRFRRTVAGWPTGKFRDRLVAMAATAGIAVIAVDPAYTTKWGTQHWLPALQTSDPTMDGHRAASVVIGRRGCGFRARRKPVGPRTRQRTRVGRSTGIAVCKSRVSRSRVTRTPKAQDAAGPPDP